MLHVILDMDRDIRDDATMAREETRRRILQAVNTVLADEHPASLSVPAVAAVAGMSVRTVYRYFPTKQELLDAVATQYPDRAGWPDVWEFDTMAEAEDRLTRLWVSFAEDLPAVRAQHRSELGAELRELRLRESRTSTANVLATMHDGIGEDDLATLADLTIALSSSSMFLELHDRLGMPPAEAARLVVWAASAIHHRYASEGGQFT